MKRILWPTCVGLLIITAALADAGEPATQPDSRDADAPKAEVTPVLEPDAEVMKIIDSLGDGQCARLPRFKVTGDLNEVARKYNLHVRGPGSRDYCIKMAWMPDRKRAIFYGANHGVPHRLNDVWEFDLPSNTWVCLYGPDANKGHGGDWSDVDAESDQTKAGIIRTRRGGPAIIGHSWWNMTYDNQLRAMLTPCSWSMSHPAYFKLLQQGKHRPPLWAFFPEKKRWEPIVGASGSLPGYENARQMEYVAELGGTLWILSGGMYHYDSRACVWKLMGSSKKCGALPPREAVAAYLPDRKIIVTHGRAGQGAPSKGWPESVTHHYSVEQDEWRLVLHSKEANNPPPGFDAVTNFAYDPVAKVCLLWDPRYTKSLWAYDPQEVKWTKIETKGEQPGGGLLAYFDIERNVFVNAEGGWVYRHKRRDEPRK